MIGVVAQGKQRSSLGPSTTVLSLAGRPVGLRVKQIALEVTAGPDAGARALLHGRQVAVGSHPSNELVLRDPAVSRFHFRIRADGKGYCLLDAGSTNGTFVQGVLVDRGYLADGMRIQAGGSTIVVRFAQDETEIELSAESSFGELLGQSLRMREVFASARRAATTHATVLLLGETGTGKDVLARAIHDHSPRKEARFVVFDCAATPATLMESVLFGHKKGAFTGADADRPGVLERAERGTVFLDEIGELPLELQPKLLRALDGKAITPIGGRQEVPVDVRIVAATNRDLRDMVARETFRADLFYRLAVVTLEVPPLRERSEDIPLLVGHFLRNLVVREGWDASALEPQLVSALHALSRYQWPGNIRELRNAVERAAVMADPEEIGRDARAMLAPTGGVACVRLPMQKAREQFDREYMRDVLGAAGGDVKSAAEIAGIHPKSFARLLRRYRVEKG
jgi:transcriptional regulator with PAS, ATPase and Fis domain